MFNKQKQEHETMEIDSQTIGDGVTNIHKNDGTMHDTEDYQPRFDFKYYREQISNRNAQNLMKKYIQMNDTISKTDLKNETI